MPERARSRSVRRPRRDLAPRALPLLSLLLLVLAGPLAAAPAGVPAQQERETAGARRAVRAQETRDKSTRGTDCVDRDAKKPVVNPDGPQPKYVCKEPEITKQPVWMGRPLTYTFEFENQGEADLHILLRGG